VIKHQEAFSSSACCRNVSAPAVPNDATANGAVGRVPSSVRTSTTTPANLFFTVRGNPTPLAGWFCVADEAGFPTSSCQTTAGGYTEQQFAIHIAVDSEPAGVVQDLGDKARFGLMEFKGNDGIKVLTPIGWRQSVDFTSTSPVTYNTNKAALIAAVESSFPATNTPLGESLYEGVRYIAQLNSAFFPTSYVYPIAFSSSGGANFGNAGAGSLGPSEMSVLTGTETCPAGYITSACGRDPFVYGSNHSPAWASPTQVVTCCKTFIIVFTDGEPTQDLTSHANLQDKAHAAHGTHCTGSTASTTPPTTCFVGNATLDTTAEQAPFLLAQHKTDYSTAVHHLDDVAYWAHTVDLRQATIPDINVAGHDLPGFQNVTVYSFFAFGNITGREILMQAARQGGFEDQNGNNLPDLTSEYDRVNNDTGVLTPDGIPDTYFESQNVDDLKDKLLAAISSILQKAASGTSVSVLATSSTGEGAIYQAYFFPTTFVNIGSVTNQVLWTGFAQGLFIDKFGNLREDYSASGCTGNPDGQLVLTHDCIIKIRLDTDATSPTFGQVLIDRFKDDGSASGSTAGDGVADTTTPFETVTLTTNGISNVKPIWEAGRQLALLDPGTSCESQATGWPKTATLSESGRTCRRMLTWADLSNGGGASSNELLEFSSANAAALCPFLGAGAVLHCNSTNAAAITAADITADPSLAGCTGLTRQTCARNEATNIINFVRGFNVTGYRDRTMNVLDTGGATVQKVWKLSDIINSTPIVVGAPKERFDVIYGDATYASYFQRYRDRRQVAYVGANDGMLHAFNAGFFTADNAVIDGSGPTVQVRFTKTPKVAGTSTDCSALPCDASVATYGFRTDAPPLGAELWAFLPQDLLPQLRWLTSANYDHVYYVDLKPKVTDARIFTADADHPGGWGTILIGGFRLGGGCSNCTGGKGTARVVNADFNGDGDTTDSGSGSTAGSDYRVFLSSYFVLDITNPEKEPRLLWTFRDQDLGLTTAAPAVLRVNPAADAKTSSTNERWYVVFGSGPTHHDGFSGQTGKIYVVDLKLGPVGAFTSINRTTGSDAGGTACSTTLPCVAVGNSDSSERVRVFSTGQAGSFMGDVVTLDSNLDYRVDAIYAGYTVCNGASTSSSCGGSGPVWTGAMWRLTTNSGDTDPDTWGVSSAPTKLISTFAFTTAQATTCTNASPCKVGPVTAAPSLTSDDTNSIWVLFGTGRFFSNNDKSNVDIQHYFGVKDSFITAGSPAQTTERNNLFNSSNVIVCSNCAAGGNVSTTGSTTTFDTSFTDTGPSGLLGLVMASDGWFTTFSDPPNPLTPGERNLNAGTLVGGTLFFTTFTPVSDVCTASGTGLLYAVFYRTGGPYTESALGTTASGSNLLVRRSVSLGQGLPSQAAIQIGAQGSGTSGTSSSSGCAGRTTVYIQSSTGVLGQQCGKTALQSWSRMVSWRDL
jgi:type IV pilus assembly protein PilY1